MSVVDRSVQNDGALEKDPGQFLRSLAALKAACALYPEGHPSIDSHVEESYQRVQELIAENSRVEIDMFAVQRYEFFFFAIERIIYFHCHISSFPFRLSASSAILETSSGKSNK